MAHLYQFAQLILIKFSCLDNESLAHAAPSSWWDVLLPYWMQHFIWILSEHVMNFITN